MSRFSRYAALIAFGILVSARVTAVSPSRQYRMIDLGSLINEDSVAQAINERGQVVGVRWFELPEGDCIDDWCPRTAVLWEKGTVTDLAKPFDWDDSITPLDINNRGQIVGDVWRYPYFFEPPYSTTLGLLWERPTVVRALKSPWWGTASRINEPGIIVGSIIHAVDGSTVTHAALWRDGSTIDLGTLPGTNISEATRVNNAGQIVGWSIDWRPPYDEPYHAVLWNGSVVTDLGTLTGQGGSALAADINDRGQVVGMSSTVAVRPGDLGDQHAVLWEQGTVADLGTLAGAGGRSQAAAINDRGQIVGWSSTAALAVGEFGDQHAVLWEQGTITDLGTLTGPGGRSDAAAINNRGQIVGSSVSPTGRIHAVLWEPAGAR